MFGGYVDMRDYDGCEMIGTNAANNAYVPGARIRQIIRRGMLCFVAARIISKEAYSSNLDTQTWIT